MKIWSVLCHTGEEKKKSRPNEQETRQLLAIGDSSQQCEEENRDDCDQNKGGTRPEKEGDCTPTTDDT